MNQGALSIPHPEDAGQQLRRLLGVARRVAKKWWVLPIALLVGALACLLFFVLRTAHYRSETVILYSPSLLDTDESGLASEKPHNTATRLQETLNARPRLERIIKQFGLYPKTVERYGYVDAVDEFREHIGFRAPGSDTYTISFDGISPEQAQDVTAALAESLIKEDRSLRRKRAELVRQFLSKEQDRTEESLRDAEMHLAEFLAEHPAFALDSTLMLPGAPPTGAAIRAAQASNQQADTASAEPRWKAVRVPVHSKGNEGSFSVPAELAAAKRRAETALQTSEAQLAEMKMRLTSAHPDVQAVAADVAHARRQVEAADAAIAAAAREQKATARAPKKRIVYRRQRSKEADPKQVEEPQKAPDEIVNLETTWAHLTRDVSEARERNSQLETRLFQADIAASSENGNRDALITILDPAYLPVKTTPPGPLTIAAIFLALAALVGGLVAVGMAILDDRVVRAADLEGFKGLVVEIPMHSQPRRKA